MLSEVLKNTGLDYLRLSSGSFVIFESAKKNPMYGSLAGLVYDRETGKPLTNANVLVTDANTGTSTNEFGRFSISPLLSGLYEITITYVGYQTTRDTVYIPLSNDDPKKFYLESKPVIIEPIVISGIQQRLPYEFTNGERVDSLTQFSNSFSGTADAKK